MKRKVLCALCALVILTCVFCIPAFAEETETFVYDLAGILSDSEASELNEAAKDVSLRYGCGVYITIFDDMAEYGYQDIEAFAQAVVGQWALGVGAENNAVTLGVPIARTASGEDDGIDTEALEELLKKEKNAKLIYVIPTFQNPTGITLSLERRRALAALASKYGVVIAEDDPYRDLRYSGEALPPIQSFDEEGWVVYMSSFSKYISPGMRLGAAVVRVPQLLRKMVIGK